MAERAREDWVVSGAGRSTDPIEAEEEAVNTFASHPLEAAASRAGPR